MKNTIKTALIAFICIGFVSFAHAEETKAEDHSAHHPEGQAKTETKGGMMGDGMMGKMDMSQMMGMMHECMSMHKDGKMCDHSMMEKCQKQMGKGDCQKMMKEAKAKDKNTKK